MPCTNACGGQSQCANWRVANRCVIANVLASEKLPLKGSTGTRNYPVKADPIEIDGVGRHDLDVAFHSDGANSVDTRDKQWHE